MDAATSLHPTDQTLRSYGLGKLDDPSAEAVNRHLEGCTGCRSRVAEMSSDSFLDRVRSAQREQGTSTLGRSLAEWTGSVSGPNGSAPPPADTLPRGLADHPDYEVKKELGRGGMGVVYLAHNRLMGRDEVLKVMGREIVTRPGLLDRFLREIRAVAKLRHPNIVTAYSAFRLGESIVFAMEYVKGLDLSRMVKAKGPMPVAHACSFVRQAALGLQHAHEEGLVHRDIKPGNLMLSSQGNRAIVKVLDFGLAKASRDQKLDGGLTHEGQALGTPDYIAPEQILDAPNADIRADIYSLGGTLFYLLTGRPPFRATSLYDMYQAHISRDADPLNLVRPEVPAELAALVAKMMAKDPGRRFQAPGEVDEALTPFFKKEKSVFTSPKPEVSQAGQAAGGRTTAGVAFPSPRLAMKTGGPNVKDMNATEPSIPTTRCESLIRSREVDSPAEGLRASSPVLSPPGSRRLKWLAAPLFGLIVLGVIILIRTNYYKPQMMIMARQPLGTDTGGVEDLQNTSKGKSARKVGATIEDSSGIASGIQAHDDFEGPSGGSAETLQSTNTSSVTDENSKGVDSPGDSIPVQTGDLQQVLVVNPPSSTTESDGFSARFNGRDKSGWLDGPTSQGEWLVVNGALTGLGGGRQGFPAYLLSEGRNYSDFRLRASTKFTRGNAGGLLLRHTASKGRMDGYFISLSCTKNLIDQTVCVARIARLTNFRYGDRIAWSGVPVEVQVPEGGWSMVEVTAKGNHLAVTVDGEPAVNYQDDVGFYSRGQIGFVCNSDSRIEINSVAVKAEPSGRTIQLFNGRDKAGWIESPHNKGEWTVVNGILVARGSGPGNGSSILNTVRDDFKNFKLHLVLRYPQEGHGQIEIRHSQSQLARNGYMICQSSWPSTDRWQIPVGSIAKMTNHPYGRGIDWNKLAVSYPVPEGAWNTLDITASNERIVTSVNRKVAADFTDATS